MAGVDEDLYEQIAKAKTNGGGNFIKDGRYSLMVRRLLLEKKHGGKSWFIAELRVITSEAVDVVDRNPNEEGKEIKPNAPGSDVTFLCPMGEDWGPGKAKSFLCAVDGTDPQELDESNTEGVAKFVQLLKAATSKAQLLRGAVVNMSTYRKVTKQGKKPGTWSVRENWEHVPQSMDAIRANRAQLDTVSPIKPETAATAA